MAEREKLIEEIKGLQKNQSNFSLKEIDEEIQKLLTKYCPVHYTLSGTTEKRINQIIEVINF